MKRVTGIGGIFFKCDDSDAQRTWYQEKLGIEPQPWGGHVFMWREDADPKEQGYTVWSPFKSDSDYFGPSNQKFMVNYRVADLDALLVELRAAGVELAGEPTSEANGKFAWILDPEGNKIELWEPVPSATDPYLGNGE